MQNSQFLPTPESAYCTLLLSNSYLSGAILLAVQLRSLDNSRPIACLVADNSLFSDHTINLLNQVFDKIVFVDPIDAGDSPELQLLKRPDLRLTTTKIHLWGLPYKRVVYLDADTLPLQPLGDLFELDLPSSRYLGAAPDCGWPDLFNSGVLVLEPDKDLAQSLIKKLPSMNLIDGSDQGLLNQEFGWVRIPFLYNVTINASYEYLPAYSKFKNDVKVLHFIGNQKPWDQSAGDPSECVRQWWSTYFRIKETTNLAMEPLSNNSSSTTEQPWLSGTPRFSLEKTITAPPGHWDARTHEPFKNSRPEGEALAKRIRNISLDDAPSNSSTAGHNDSTGNQGSNRSDELDSVKTMGQGGSHIFPIFGPSLVAFPFESDTMHKHTTEREF